MRSHRSSGVFAAFPCAACVAVAVAVLSAAVVLPACNSGRNVEPRRVAPVVRDIPSVLRGTIGAETTIRGTEPQLVSGFGVVVGLNGTGGGELPVQVQATMERELARGGIGRGSPLDLGPLDGVSPREFLRSPDVAVVIVEAVVPPGTPEGTEFDVRVRSLPGSSVTSLEGGILWTTELRLGPATVFGGVRTRKIAEARGPVFINPFAEPGASEADPVTRNAGRVLGGGRLTDPLRLELVLDNPSWSRASLIQSAINSRFPPSRGDEGQTARGRSAESISIRVPQAYKERPAEFLQLLRFTRIDQSFPQEHAKRYTEELKRQPGLAEELSWALQAIGKPAVPFLATMYDYPEFVPRMAALRAGAKLGDARTVPHLAEMARTGPTLFRLESIDLLGEMPPNPRVNTALRELLESSDLDVRVGAYEALRTRFDPAVRQYAASDNKFILERVDAGEPMIYVTQQGKPRIVLFGEGLEISRPTLMSAWSDRLMLAADSAEDPVRIYFRDHRTGQVHQQRVPEAVDELVRFLAHKPSPEDPRPGLDMTYSQVVGALYEMHRHGVVDAAFATERDRLLAALLKAADETVIHDRPETTAEAAREREALLVYRPDDAEIAERREARPAERGSLVVPLGPAGEGRDR